MKVRRISKGVIAGKERYRLRVVVDLKNAQAKRLGWKEGTEVVAEDHPEGILVRRLKRAD